VGWRRRWWRSGTERETAEGFAAVWREPAAEVGAGGDDAGRINVAVDLCPPSVGVGRPRAGAGILRCMNPVPAHERSLQVVIYREGDGFVVQCLNVDVASDGATEAEARANILEALELYFDEPAAQADYQPVADAHVERLILKSA